MLGKFGVFDFVFPDPDNLPTEVLKILVVRPIAIHVALEFSSPIFVVTVRHCGVFRATVPETAVYEHRNFLGWENDVDVDAASFKFDVAVFSEAES